ncbi:sodium:solute symporter family protein [Metallumcola ferriviriculae]|uniref:Sodium:solute symporter family protein n=1 Tax=Metallumcola ferriviriculae TaxID=3039180 RepID=A0AAU0UI51_9FIRM|nr:sodium:solute symporter family protein [Desulfitibacteraceae bacterium MK1]
MSQTHIYTALAIYIVLGTIVAFVSRQGMGKSMTDYFLAGRTLGGFVGALTYSATTYSAFMMVGLAGLTFTGGVGAMGFELIYLSGLVLVAFFGPRFWLVGKKYNYVTPAEMLGHRYDSRTLALVAAVAYSIFLIPYSAVQLMGVGYLVTGMSGGSISFMTGVILATILAIIWAWIAGLRSVAWTDSLQSLLMIIASLVVVYTVVYKGLGGFGSLANTLENDYPQWLVVPGPGLFSFKTFLGLSLPWFFFSISNPQVSQRLFVPKSMKSMRLTVMGFLGFGLIYTLVSIIWGFSAKVLLPNLENADLATPTLLALPIVPKALALVVMVGITAAAISTIDSILLTLSSVLSRDVYGNLRKDTSEAKQLRFGKLAIPFIAVLALLFARLKLGLIAVLSVASSAGLLVTVPAIFGAFFWKRGTAAGAITSILGGGAVSIFLQFSGFKPLGHWPGVWALLVATTLYYLVSYLTQPPEQVAEEFLGYLSKELKEKGVV